MAQKTLRDFLQETEDAISSGRVETALAHCQSILASFPESLEAQRLLGEVYLAQTRLEDALHSFDWVLTNDPENVIAYCNRALVSERMSDLETALDCYQQAYELSRGNSQIRQEFNQLSARVGQEGFMFSRAGLARLYMRGDLLPLAIQEWEIVLAITPDRMDARTGMLEACWRDGTFERAEQLATEILQDTPGCLKALLILAHITYSKENAGKAQELLRQAEKLDPDCIMAQELFADLLVSHPHLPFLALVKKPPVIVDTVLKAAAPAVPAKQSSPEFASDLADRATMASLPGALLEQNDVSLSGLNGSDSSPLAQWGSSEGWNNDTTLVKPKEDPTDGPPVSWSGLETISGERENPLLPVASQGMPGTEQKQAGLSEPEPWQMLQEALSSMPGFAPESTPEEQPVSWQQAETPSLSGLEMQGQPATPLASSGVSWTPPQEEKATPSWAASLQAEDVNASPPPPTWLGMLTQADRQQMENAASPVELPPDPVEPPVLQKQEELPAPVVPQMEEIPEDGEESLFGPAWLKSLGAESLDGELPAAVAMQESEPIVAQPFVSNESPQKSEPQLEIESWQPVVLNAADAVVKEPVTTYTAPEPVSDLHLWEQTPAPSTPSIQDDPWQHMLPAASMSGQATWEEPPVEPLAPAQNLEQVNATPWNAGPMIEPASDLWQALTPEPSVSNPWQTQEPEPLPSSAIDPWQASDFGAVGISAQEAALYEPQRTQEEQGQLENDMVTTLEELEKNLMAQGFVSMEPNSLAVIAQHQEPPQPVAPPVFSDEPPMPLFPGEPVQQQQEAPQQSLSSALAELGYVASSMPVDDIAPEEESSVAGFEWLQGLQATPVVPPSVTPEVTPFAPVATERAEPQWVRDLRNTSVPAQTEVPVEPSFSPTPLPPAAQIVPESEPAAQKELYETVKTPAARGNPFLEGELETTMKRPAIRLQALQRGSGIREKPVSNGLIARARAAERKEPFIAKPGAGGEGNITYRDRLVKGYQYQLVGNYDEAMQEYRTIIRSAPELLGDVVSNVRALLKIVPRYAAGYRVLGDAYMRQGEYLQAMESYNKALTMAKKAKGS